MSPRGLLPVLVLDDGTVIDETIAICRYFEESRPEPPLMGTDALTRAQVERWQRIVEFDAGTAVADAFRNTFPAYANRAVAGRSGDAAIPELADRGRRRLETFYDLLERRLADSRDPAPMIAGPDYSVADITALCILDFAKALKLGYGDNRPHLAQWHATVRARPSSRA
jgi:glutathione S-transferase